MHKYVQENERHAILCDFHILTTYLIPTKRLDLVLFDKNILRWISSSRRFFFHVLISCSNYSSYDKYNWLLLVH